ncbi:hypothetical protein MPNT_20206 [Candidatus Methylacidithermus pantelleriae]|uniref:Uncharacterized protein n=1 Tax=Candidatus Methylacidithermus pantelleriae TaxID=2744239 RepID=A0A8J2BJC1_9BACT|nr:hypothetical protein MPNT_20206 [Candidatus Methylacidithermus pantelleriae]
MFGNLTNLWSAQKKIYEGGFGFQGKSAEKTMEEWASRVLLRMLGLCQRFFWGSRNAEPQGEFDEPLEADASPSLGRTWFSGGMQGASR